MTIATTVATELEYRVGRRATTFALGDHVPDEAWPGDRIAMISRDLVPPDLKTEGERSGRSNPVTARTLSKSSDRT